MKQQDSASKVPFARMAPSPMSHREDEKLPFDDEEEETVAKVAKKEETVADSMTHGLLCPRCKVSMASIPALLVHQGACAVRPHTPDLKEKFDIQRDQFHLLFNEARDIHGQLHQAKIDIAVAQDTAAQWKEMAKKDTGEQTTSGSNTVDSEVQTETDQYVEELKDQCSKGTAELEAQIMRMNRLSQSLHEIQLHHSSLKKASQESASVHEQKLEQQQKALLAREAELQQVHATETALREQVNRLEEECNELRTSANQCQNLQRQVEDLKQQVAHWREERDAIAKQHQTDKAALEQKVIELTQELSTTIASSDQTKNNLQEEMNAKSAALYNAQIAREQLAAQLKTMVEQQAESDLLEAEQRRRLAILEKQLFEVGFQTNTNTATTVYRSDVSDEFDEQGTIDCISLDDDTRLVLTHNHRSLQDISIRHLHVCCMLYIDVNSVSSRRPNRFLTIQCRALKLVTTTLSWKKVDALRSLNRCVFGFLNIRTNVDGC